MSRSTVSRRLREFIGVALFGAALIWVIALVSYEPADPVWFFSTGGHTDPVNFAGGLEPSSPNSRSNYSGTPCT